MSRPAFERPNAELETQLTAMGERLAWLATPELTTGVLDGLACPTPLPKRNRRRWWLAAEVVALLIGGALLLASSTVRTSVADFLGIDGMRIEFGEPDTTSNLLPALGTPTSMQDFERWLPFNPRQPAALGEPDAVYLRLLDNGEMLGMMAWQPSDNLPETAETGLGALLMEFDPPDDMVMVLKTVGLSTGTVTDTTVSRQPDFWVEGASNLTIFGNDSSESRPSGDVLIWEDEGIGFRLESALTMDQAIAIAIAESLKSMSS